MNGHKTPINTNNFNRTYINKLNETGGAGDWGTDKARARLQKDTPGQEITKGKKQSNN